MSLRTYDKTLENYWDGGKNCSWPVAPIDRKANEPLPKLQPGMWVEVPGVGGRGIVIAINDEQLTVLWSEPTVTAQENLTKQMVKQIQEEMDAEILRDLMNV